MGPLLSAVRVVGIPDPNTPIAALTLNVGQLGDGQPVDADAAVSITPSSEGVQAQIGLPSPVAPSSDGLTLLGVAAHSGTFTLDRITVTYQESEEATP